MNKMFFPLVVLLLFAVFSCKEKQRLPVVRSLYVQTTGCESSCPIFTIAVHQDRKIIFRAVANNKDTGTFKAVLPQSTYDSLLSLLQQTDFPRIEKEYGVKEESVPTAITTIMYDTNQIKRITDHGKQGTPALKKLYDFVFALRENQQWQ